MCFGPLGLPPCSFSSSRFGFLNVGRHSAPPRREAKSFPVLNIANRDIIQWKTQRAHQPQRKLLPAFWSKRSLFSAKVFLFLSNEMRSSQLLWMNCTPGMIYMFLIGFDTWTEGMQDWKWHLHLRVKYPGFLSVVFLCRSSHNSKVPCFHSTVFCTVETENHFMLHYYSNSARLCHFPFNWSGIYDCPWFGWVTKGWVGKKQFFGWIMFPCLGWVQRHLTWLLSVNWAR